MNGSDDRVGSRGATRARSTKTVEIRDTIMNRHIQSSQEVVDDSVFVGGRGVHGEAGLQQSGKVADSEHTDISDLNLRTWQDKVELVRDANRDREIQAHSGDLGVRKEGHVVAIEVLLGPGRVVHREQEDQPGEVDQVEQAGGVLRLDNEQ